MLDYHCYCPLEHSVCMMACNVVQLQPALSAVVSTHPTLCRQTMPCCVSHTILIHNFRGIISYRNAYWIVLTKWWLWSFNVGLTIAYLELVLTPCHFVAVNQANVWAGTALSVCWIRLDDCRLPYTRYALSSVCIDRLNSGTGSSSDGHTRPYLYPISYT